MSKCFITCKQPHLCDFRETFWQRKRHPARRMDRGKLNGTFIDIILTRLVNLKCHTDPAMISIQNGRHHFSINRKPTFQVKGLGKNMAYVTLKVYDDFVTFVLIVCLYRFLTSISTIIIILISRWIVHMMEVITKAQDETQELLCG